MATTVDADISFFAESSSPYFFPPPPLTVHDDVVVVVVVDNLPFFVRVCVWFRCVFGIVFFPPTVTHSNPVTDHWTSFQRDVVLRLNGSG